MIKVFCSKIRYVLVQFVARGGQDTWKLLKETQKLWLNLKALIEPCEFRKLTQKLWLNLKSSDM